MSDVTPPSAPAAAAPLTRAERARGRRLAIASHPFGMTHRTVFTAPLPTLALLLLGASESTVGLQSALVSAALVLQLPVLLLVSRVSKRAILVGAHTFGVLSVLPLLGFRSFGELPGDGAILLAMLCFAFAAAGIGASETVWFPLLRGYVESGRIGRFFGTIRSGWHLTLIVYFLGSQAWLARHPGDFAPLFAVGVACGILRIALIVRLPERSEKSPERIRIRDALALLRESPMRRYLAGVCCAASVRTATLPFVVVMLRRELGLSEAQLLYTAVATYAGGLASLYLWGRAVDVLGPAPVFRQSCIGMAGLVSALVFVNSPGSATVLAVVGFFFFYAVLSAGFGVADTHVLFGLTPPHAPSRALVLANVAVGTASALTPAASGWVLEHALGGAEDHLLVYHVFFAGMALLQALAFLPLRGFTRVGARSPTEAAVPPWQPPS